jgi:hypothetical protein
MVPMSPAWAAGDEPAGHGGHTRNAVAESRRETDRMVAGTCVSSSR